MAALRAEALRVGTSFIFTNTKLYARIVRVPNKRTKVKNEKTVIKRKSNETPQVVPAKKIKNGNQLKNIQINRKINEDNKRRIITKRFE